MPSFRTFALVALPLALTGCYTSTTPLISAAQAVFPYQKIIYWQASDAAMMTLIHQGDAYIATDDRGDIDQFRFMPVTGSAGVYIAQVGMKTDKGDAYLYGLVRLDTAANTASTYATAAATSDAGPGLPLCADSDDTICLTDLRPYITHAMALAAGNATPDTIYSVMLVP